MDISPRYYTLSQMAKNSSLKEEIDRIIEEVLRDFRQMFGRERLTAKKR